LVRRCRQNADGKSFAGKSPAKAAGGRARVIGYQLPRVADPLMQQQRRILAKCTVADFGRRGRGV